MFVSKRVWGHNIAWETANLKGKCTAGAAISQRREAIREQNFLQRGTPSWGCEWHHEWSSKRCGLDHRQGKACPRCRPDWSRSLKTKFTIGSNWHEEWQLLTVKRPAHGIQSPNSRGNWKKLSVQNSKWGIMQILTSKFNGTESNFTTLSSHQWSTHDEYDKRCRTYSEQSCTDEASSPPPTK